VNSGGLVSRWGLRIFGVLYVGLLVGVPVGSVVYRALAPGFSSAYDSVTSPTGLHALVLTLEVAALAVALNTAFGLGIAIVLARHRFPGASVLEMLVDLPLSISPVVVGLALLLCYSSTEGWLGPWLATHGIHVLFAFPGIVAASAFVSLPYVVREVTPVLVELGDEQEQAAQTLGAGSWTVFWRITLPSVRWGLAYGVLLTTARVLGEFGAVSIVSGNIIGHTQTLTQFVDDDLVNFDTPGAYAGALLLALISVLVLAALSISRSKERSLR
jgi:sulfate/thiosulfate transport system permease protein